MFSVALAKNVADAREMYAAAERNGVMLQMGYGHDFSRGRARVA